MSDQVGRRVVLDKPMNEEGRKSFLESVYYLSNRISRVDFVGDDALLEADLPSETMWASLVEDVQELATRISASTPKKPFRVVHSYDGEIHYTTDPFEQLVASRDVVQTSAGVFVIQGEFYKRFRNLDRQFRTYAISRGSEEQFLPVTVPVKSLSDCGYLKSFPQHAYFASPVARDFSKLKHVSDVSKGGFVPSAELDASTTILSPTVCYHCFESLKAFDLTSNTRLTAVNQCHRHELKNAKGLSRLQTYTMREIVFLGEQEFVSSEREAILAHSTSLFESWGLRFRVVVASDPFFASGAESKKSFQMLTASKLEMQFYIPHSDSWLAVASYNHHQASLTDSYGIRLNSNGAQSGCVGYGYERLLYALYSQKGFDDAVWPATLLLPNSAEHASL